MISYLPEDAKIEKYTTIKEIDDVLSNAQVDINTKVKCYLDKSFIFSSLNDDAKALEYVDMIFSIANDHEKQIATSMK